MLHTEDREIAALLLQGRFGLEKESLRVTEEGYLAHTPHPFPGDPHIVRDFSENQTEINTPVTDSAQEAVNSLLHYTRYIQRTLRALPEPELLWPFSNPPYIRNELDIPIAQFYGEQREKTTYREHLAERYGRYRMTFSGIHFNYSFSEELLRTEFRKYGAEDTLTESDGKASERPGAANAAAGKQTDDQADPDAAFRQFRDTFYLELAEKVLARGWILIALTAASPVTDSSFIEKGKFDGDSFLGMASVRCSELGYWNSFTPTLSYESVAAYADSIQYYVDENWIQAPSELYYPVRLKPRGAYRLDALRQEGVDHIELRMLDLNPLTESGIDVRDVRFSQLFLVWLASLPPAPLKNCDQIFAIQNQKNAAHYDLKTVNRVCTASPVRSLADEGARMLEEMKQFYRPFCPEALEVLEFETEKMLDPEARYAWQIRKRFDGGFVRKGLHYASEAAAGKAEAAEPAFSEKRGAV